MPLSRRHILQAAAVVPFRSVRGAPANSAGTVGLIGSGGRGTFDASLLVKHTGARLTALCDIFDDRLERAKKNIPIADPKVIRTTTIFWPATWTRSSSPPPSSSTPSISKRR